MKKILIPIDGSQYAIKAIEKGKEMAKAFGGEVVLLNVVQVNFPLVAAGPFAQNAEFVKKSYEEADKASKVLLAESQKGFEEAGIKAETVSLNGNAADAIINYINENEFDLVIMGSHGLGAIRNRMLTGSVTTKILHHVEKPVLVIK